MTFYYEILGGHTHVRVFAGLKRPGATMAVRGKCGDLVFHNEEWKQFELILHRAGFETFREGVDQDAVPDDTPADAGAGV